MNKKLSKEMSARTTDDSSTKDEDMQVSPASSIDLVEWLTQKEMSLQAAGYRKSSGSSLRNEDFVFCKTFKDGEKKLYQIGVLFYDFRKYIDRDPSANRIGVQYECMILCECYARIDLSVSKEGIDFNEFEKMSKTFYEAMSAYCC